MFSMLIGLPGGKITISGQLSLFVEPLISYTLPAGVQGYNPRPDI